MGLTDVIGYTYTLSNLEQATPSGFDYRPKTSLTTRKFPEYSITGKPYPTKCMLLTAADLTT